jgi:hypothetical protein
LLLHTRLGGPGRPDAALSDSECREVTRAGRSRNHAELRKLLHDGGRATASFTALFHLSTTAVGVPAGAASPTHTTRSKFLYPASAIVGTLGSSGKRLGLVIARPLSLPPCKKLMTTDVSATM